MSHEPTPLEPLLALTATQLSPEEARLERIRTSALLIGDTLRRSRIEGLTVLEMHPFGSLARGTALSAFDDYDLLAVFHRDVLRARWGSRPCPVAVLQSLAAWAESILEELFEGIRVTVREQAHSLGLTFEPEGASCFRIDLVPSYGTPGQARVHVTRVQPQRAWIPAYPTAMKSRLERTAFRCPLLRPAIRLLKGWKAAQGVWFPGYGIELVVLRQLERLPGPLTIEAVLQRFFASLSDASPDASLRFGRSRKLAPMVLVDPWTSANVLAKGTEQDRQKLIQSAGMALDLLSRARDALADGGVTEARSLLQTLLVGDQRNLTMDLIREREEVPPLWR